MAVTSGGQWHSLWRSLRFATTLLFVASHIQAVSSEPGEGTKGILDDLQSAILTREHAAYGRQEMQSFEYPSLDFSWPKGLSETELDKFRNEESVKSLVSLIQKQTSQWRGGKVYAAQERQIAPRSIEACHALRDSNLGLGEGSAKKKSDKGESEPERVESTLGLPELRIEKMCPIIAAEKANGDADALAGFVVDLLMPIMQAHDLLQKDPEISIVTDLGETNGTDAHPTVLRQLWTRLGFGADRVLQYEPDRSYAVGELVEVCHAPVAHPALLAAFRSLIGLTDSDIYRKSERVIFVLPEAALEDLSADLIDRLEGEFGEDLVLVADSLPAGSTATIEKHFIRTSDAVMNGTLSHARAILGFSEQQLYVYSLFSPSTTTIIELYMFSGEEHSKRVTGSKSNHEVQSGIPLNWLYASLAGQDFWRIQCSLGPSGKAAADWDKIVGAIGKTQGSSPEKDSAKARKFTLVVTISASRIDHVKSKLAPAILSTPRDMVDVKLISSNPEACQQAPPDLQCITAPKYIPEGDPPIEGDTMERYHWYSQETADMAFALAQVSEDAIGIFFEDDIVATSNWFNKTLATLDKMPDSWAMLDLYTPGKVRSKDGDLYHFYCCTQAFALNVGRSKALSDYLYKRVGEQPPDWLIRDYQDDEDNEFEVRATNPSLFQHGFMQSTLDDELKRKTPTHMSSTFKV